MELQKLTNEIAEINNKQTSDFMNKFINQFAAPNSGSLSGNGVVHVDVEVVDRRGILAVSRTKIIPDFSTNDSYNSSNRVCFNAAYGAQGSRSKLIFYINKRVHNPAYDYYIDWLTNTPLIQFLIKQSDISVLPTIDSDFPKNTPDHAKSNFKTKIVIQESCPMIFATAVLGMYRILQEMIYIPIFMYRAMKECPQLFNNDPMLAFIIAHRYKFSSRFDIRLDSPFIHSDHVPTSGGVAWKIRKGLFDIKYIEQKYKSNKTKSWGAGGYRPTFNGQLFAVNQSARTRSLLAQEESLKSISDILSAFYPNFSKDKIEEVLNLSYVSLGIPTMTANFAEIMEKMMPLSSIQSLIKEYNYKPSEVDENE